MNLRKWLRRTRRSTMRTAATARRRRTRWLEWRGRSQERYILRLRFSTSQIGILESLSWDLKYVISYSQNESRRMSEANIDSKLPTRKPSAANSANSSAMPSRNWSRHSSPTRGEILRMEDEMHTVNRLDEIRFSKKQSH